MDTGGHARARRPRRRRWRRRHGEGLSGQLLAYQANKPIVDRLLKEAGFEGDNAVSALLGGIEKKEPSTA